MSYSLRVIRKGDEELILQARNSDAVRPFMCSQAMITPEVHAKWFAARLERAGVAPYFVFSHEGAAIGVVGITQYNEEAQSGEWGFYLFAPAPKGAGTAMLAAFLDAVFARGIIRKITSLVLETNVKSLRLHEKLGFVRKGTLVGHMMVEGAAVDVAIWALGMEQWAQTRPALQCETVGVDDV